MVKNTEKVREFCQSGKVGTLYQPELPKYTKSLRFFKKIDTGHKSFL